MSNPITANDVGGYLTNKIIDEGRLPSIMQILKLAYIAQGFHLALEEGRPFFRENIYAWKYGPVISDLYYHLKGQESYDQDSHLMMTEIDVSNDPSFTERQKNILYVILKKYANLSGWDLSTLTHQAGTPWAITYEKQREDNSIIEIDLIREHFEKIITPISFAILLSQN